MGRGRFNNNRGFRPKKKKKNNERNKAFCILDAYGCPMVRCDRQELTLDHTPNSWSKVWQLMVPNKLTDFIA